MPGPARDRSHPSRTPLAEWIVGGLGLLAVGAMLVVLLLEIAVGERAPPALSISTGQATPSPTGWVLPVTVRNTGDRTAASVEVEGALGEQTATATLDYVPAQGSAKAGLIFAADPRGQPLRLRVSGYAEP